MARIRKFAAYRRLERPYTRTSKYRKKAFIRTTPNPKVVRYEMGNTTKEFKYNLKLSSKNDLQIRDNAIESARQTSNRVLESKLGTKGYFMKIRVYPFHVLRENPLAAGAGADRFSTGMSHSFGKPIGQAVQVKKGQTLFEVRVNKEDLLLGRKALTRASQKLPCSCMIEVIENQ